MNRLREVYLTVDYFQKCYLYYNNNTINYFMTFSSKCVQHVCEKNIKYGYDIR